VADDFLAIYDEHVWQVYGFFAYRLSSRLEAEDLTQITFERALRAWPRYDRERSKPLTWLIAIAQNALIDHYRRHGRNKVDPGDPSEAIDATAADPGPEESLGPDPALAAALGQLGDRERQVIGLRFGADLSGAEIADVLNLSVANVHQILSRSLRKLRDVIDSDRATSAQ
jgi:RNA polymerase sigma factor (sigma-70 family)